MRAPIMPTQAGVEPLPRLHKGAAQREGQPRTLAFKVEAKPFAWPHRTSPWWPPQYDSVSRSNAEDRFARLLLPYTLCTLTVYMTGGCMGSINVKEARRLLKSLLDRAEAGETITIARRGEVVARLVPPSRRPRRLPSLSALRRSIKRKGRALSRIVIDSRVDERA